MASNIAVDEPLLTIPEVASLIRKPSRWLADACRAEAVEHVHLGRERLFTPAQVAALVAKFTVKAEADRRLDDERARVMRALARRKAASR